MTATSATRCAVTVFSAAREVSIQPCTLGYPAERVTLRSFAHAAAAMELLGALAQWPRHGNHSAETEYLIGLGLAGLRDYTRLS